MRRGTASTWLQAGPPASSGKPATRRPRRAPGGEAFGALGRRYQDAAFGYAYAPLGDPHQAQDATQEALLDAYRRLEALRVPEAFPGWLRRIVRTHCRPAAGQGAPAPRLRPARGAGSRRRRRGRRDADDRRRRHQRPPRPRAPGDPPRPRRRLPASGDRPLPRPPRQHGQETSAVAKKAVAGKDAGDGARDAAGRATLPGRAPGGGDRLPHRPGGGGGQRRSSPWWSSSWWTAWRSTPGTPPGAPPSPGRRSAGTWTRWRCCCATGPIPGPRTARGVRPAVGPWPAPGQRQATALLRQPGRGEARCPQARARKKLGCYLPGAMTSLVYVGTYTGAERAQGISVFRLDPESGALDPLQTVDRAEQPHLPRPAPPVPGPPLPLRGGAPGGRAGTGTGAVSSFAVDPRQGTLTLLNRQPSGGASPCYVSVHPQGRVRLRRELRQRARGLLRGAAGRNPRPSLQRGAAPGQRARGAAPGWPPRPLHRPRPGRARSSLGLRPGDRPA